MNYTTVANVKLYGPIDGVVDDILLASVVQAISGRVDQYCNMIFSAQTLSGIVYNPQINIDGQLQFWVPTPQINAVTGISWKLGTSYSYTSVSDLTLIETEEHSFGSLVRALFPTFGSYRGKRMKVQLSGSVGWTSILAVPPDFELTIRRLAFWAYKKRAAVQEKSAIPSLGMIMYPSSWPEDVKQDLVPYSRRFSS